METFDSSKFLDFTPKICRNRPKKQERMPPNGMNERLLDVHENAVPKSSIAFE